MTYTQVWDRMRNQVSELGIVRDADRAHIPFDEGNKDYQTYLAWLAQGNTPTPYTPPPSVAPPAPEPAPLRIAPTVDSLVFSPPPEPAPVVVTPTPSPPPSTLEPQPAPAPMRGGLSGI